MKNIVILLLLSISLFQCKQENGVRAQAKQEATKMASSEVKPAARPAQVTVKKNEKIDPIVTPPTSADVFSLMLGNETVASGEDKCVAVTANGFNEMIGLQFTIRWNPEQLEFKGIENMGVEDMTAQSFGLSHTDKGVAVMAWIHQSLRGVSLPENSKLFDICYTAKAASGTKVPLELTTRPTPPEAINVREEILQFERIDGQIKVQ